MECRHGLSDNFCLLAVRITNTSTIRLTSLRISVAVSADVSSPVAHNCAELAPNQSQTFLSVLNLHLPMSSALVFSPVVVLTPSVAPIGSGDLAGRTFACRPFHASIRFSERKEKKRHFLIERKNSVLRRPLVIVPSDFVCLWNLFAPSVVERLMTRQPLTAASFQNVCLLSVDSPFLSFFWGE